MSAALGTPLAVGGIGIACGQQGPDCVQRVWQPGGGIGAVVVIALQGIGIGLRRAAYVVGQQGLPAACRALRNEMAGTGGLDAAVSGHAAMQRQIGCSSVYGGMLARGGVGCIHPAGPASRLWADQNIQCGIQH